MIHVATELLRQTFEHHRPLINSFLSKHNYELGTIFDFETDVVSVDDFPVIMLGSMREDRTYVDAPGVIESRYMCEVSGYTHLEDRQDSADMVREFAAGVLWMFEHGDIQNRDMLFAEYQAKWPHHEMTPQIFRLHYHSEVPFQSVSTDYGVVAGTLCRYWRGSWIGYMTRSAQWALTGSQ